MAFWILLKMKCVSLMLAHVFGFQTPHFLFHLSKFGKTLKNNHMRKTTLVLASAAFCLTASAQKINGHDIRTVEASRTIMTSDDRTEAASVLTTTGTESVIWSEDFANGIPSTWQNVDAGTGGAGLWDYRGTGSGATFPADTGSRGAYAGARAPIQSATRTNGFVIIDSDWLDNNGIPGNFGGGVAPAPHMAYLITETIDLSGETSVDFSFTQYYRRFAGPGGSQAVPATYVDFSIDGGNTFPYSITYNGDISVNSATPDNDVEARDVSNWVAGQSQVQMRFRFDGDYYFWMVDDVTLQSVPKFRADFGAWGGAPAFDFIVGPAAGSSKLGTFTLDQNRDLAFDCNAISSGSAPLYNAQLSMEIVDPSGTVNTVNSPVVSSAWGGGMGPDTLTYNDLNTNAAPWQPSSIGLHYFFYNLTADSTMAGGQALSLRSDTFQFIISDSVMSLDGGVFSNSLGTPQLGDDGAAMTSRIDLTADAQLWNVKIGLSSLTVPGGFMEVAIYDSSAFTGATSGFDPNGLIATAQQTVANASGGIMTFDMTTNGVPLDLMQSMGAYYVVVTMYSNAGANLIRIGNDAQWDQPGGASLMFVVGAQWYSGYSGSRSFNSPWIHMATTQFGVGVGEEKLEASVYPNPTTDVVRIELDKDFGNYDITVSDMGGRVVLTDNQLIAQGVPAKVDMSALPKGMYIIQVTNEQARGAYRVSVE